MDKPNGKKFEVMSFEDFSEAVRKHVWTFQCDTFMQLSESIRAENKLFYTGQIAGPRYLRFMLREQQAAMKLNFKQEPLVAEQIPVQVSSEPIVVKGFTQEEVDKMLARRTDEINGMMATSDPEFDEFRVRCYYHDWYFNFTDDREVYRRSKEAHDKLEALAKEKGGKYLEHWTWKASQV